MPDNKKRRDIGKRLEHIGYVELSEKWVSAESLKYGDRVLLFDGTYGIIQSVKVNKLTKPETTYNFEVEDYHTYYVGEHSVCVHNANCGMQNKTIFNEDIGNYKNVRMDLEVGGSGKTNLHIHAVGDKFIYNGTTYVNSAGQVIPNVIGNSKIVSNGFVKAVKYAAKVGWAFP